MAELAAITTAVGSASSLIGSLGKLTGGGGTSSKKKESEKCTNYNYPLPTGGTGNWNKASHAWCGAEKALIQQMNGLNMTAPKAVYKGEAGVEGDAGIKARLADIDNVKANMATMQAAIDAKNSTLGKVESALGISSSGSTSTSSTGSSSSNLKLLALGLAGAVVVYIAWRHFK